MFAIVFAFVGGFVVGAAVAHNNPAPVEKVVDKVKGDKKE